MTPKVAQTLARHSTITLTMDRYAHVALADTSKALAAVRDVFEVADDGSVRTRAGLSGVIPGADPAQYVLGQLRALKPGLWPKSVGGGARGGTHGSGSRGDVSAFVERNVTGIARYADRHGTAAAIREGERHGIDVSWLKGGGR